MTNRPEWDIYFLLMAQVAASRSTCLRRKVGAVLVRDRQILSTGYNGAPRGVSHCEKTGCLRERRFAAALTRRSTRSPRRRRPERRRRVPGYTVRTSHVSTARRH